MTETFAALGIPFPLFEGLVDDSSEYAGKAKCSLCGRPDQLQNTIPGLWEDELHDVTGVYVFRCASCNRLTAHWDIA